ncbi:unnamed protein product [Heterobilharzia americana]|nr:unnamed protein product [Heterobilharzia americana]
MGEVLNQSVNQSLTKIINVLKKVTIYDSIKKIIWIQGKQKTKTHLISFPSNVPKYLEIEINENCCTSFFYIHKLTCYKRKSYQQFTYFDKTNELVFLKPSV